MERDKTHQYLQCHFSVIRVRESDDYSFEPFWSDAQCTERVKNLAKTPQNSILDFFTVSSPDTLAYKLLGICLFIKTSKTSFFQIFGWFFADFRDGGSQNWPNNAKNRPKIRQKLILHKNAQNPVEERPIPVVFQ